MPVFFFLKSINHCQLPWFFTSSLDCSSLSDINNIQWHVPSKDLVERPRWPVWQQQQRVCVSCKICTTWPEGSCQIRALSLILHLHRNEDHDNIYHAVSPYNVAMTPRRSQRNRSATTGPPSNNTTMAMPQQPSLMTPSERVVSPALTTTTLPRLSRRAATEDDADSRFVLNWYVALLG